MYRHEITHGREYKGTISAEGGKDGGANHAEIRFYSLQRRNCHWQEASLPASIFNYDVGFDGTRFYCQTGQASASEIAVNPSRNVKF